MKLLDFGRPDEEGFQIISSFLYFILLDYKH